MSELKLRPRLAAATLLPANAGLKLGAYITP